MELEEEILDLSFYNVPELPIETRSKTIRARACILIRGEESHSDFIIGERVSEMSKLRCGKGIELVEGESPSRLEGGAKKASIKIGEDTRFIVVGKELRTVGDKDTNFVFA